MSLSADRERVTCPCCDGWGFIYTPVQATKKDTVLNPPCAVCEGTGEATKREADKWIHAHHIK